MSGTLTKKLIERTTVTPGAPGTPGSPGQPYIPPSDYVTTAVVCNWVFLGTGQYSDDRTRNEIGRTVRICREVQVINRSPGQPYIAPTPGTPSTPSTSRTELNLGWTGGAHTVDVLTEDGAFAFSVPQASGAVVGLAANDSTTSPAEASHALQFGSGRYRVTEGGVYQGVSGVHVPGTTYRISRSAGVVKISAAGDVVYTSSTPSSGPVSLDAALYAAGDTVVYLGMTQSAEGHGAATMEPIQAAGGDPYAKGTASLGVFKASGEGYDIWRVNSSIGRFLSRGGDYAYGAGEGALGLFSVAGEAGFPEPDFGIGTARLALFLSGGQGLTGGVGGGGATMQPLLALGADAPYGASGSASNIGAEWFAFGQGGPLEDKAEMLSLLVCADGLAPFTYLAVSFTSSAAVIGSLGVQTVLSATMDSGVLASFSAGLSSVLAARFDSEMALSSQAGNTKFTGSRRAEDSKTWVFNYGTGATSEYSGFDFDQMYEREGRYYGTRGTAVYLLAGESDAGAPIDAFVSFGKQTFGTSALKHLPTFYAGLASTGELLLRVSTGKETFTYRPRRVDAHTRTQRFDLGRGLRASYYEFELFNQAGADFDLDSVEFVVLPTTRRI
ncbi:hypothetical protein [Acidovorax sp. SUPP2539]|uniref:hypothetical protein n=1 Tax=Acidovorax sp. SUPP2539 TaxID=2920878 RepID=UPI0023DE4E38|nr:hypothetical protein [Acidovorax sp. SUPP2539]GKS91224.1 hypothetical protein AVTE2539_17685 [Acidovorax sp. SUPP2539]